MTETLQNPLTGQPVDDENLKGITALAQRQYALEQKIAKLNEDLESESTKLKEVQEQLLPDAMAEVGMAYFTLKNGYAVQVDRFYAASIPKDRQDEAFAWLRKHDFDSLIKREIKCKFGKGEDQDARKIMKLLVKAGAEPEDKQFVHPQTLKAFVREQIEEGKNLPMETFGVYIGNRAKITPPTK